MGSAEAEKLKSPTSSKSADQRTGHTSQRQAASFRDNHGWLFWHQSRLLRHVTPAGQTDYDRLMSSGLYEQLTTQQQLIPHREVDDPRHGMVAAARAYKVLEPELLPFISYPYEWSFSMLKDAALLTLAIQKQAAGSGLSLRDATAYNVQWRGGRPVFIDTLSFGTAETGKPWQPYQQFCQHFLAPLALMSQVEADLLQLLRVHLDGVPLPLAAKLLPRRASLRPGIGLHLRLHARMQQRHQDDRRKTERRVSSQAAIGLIDSLERTVRSLQPPRRRTEWGDYYGQTNYSAKALEAKRQLVTKWIGKLEPGRALDLGANDGTFSRLCAERGWLTLACDIDPQAVEHNYRQVCDRKEINILPLLVDVTNPSPGLGWDNTERASWRQRAQSDVALALALIHHLAIGHNLPFAAIAQSFAELAPRLIVEFVPPQDSQVQRLLLNREPIFDHYNQAGFETEFGRWYSIEQKQAITGSKRVLYLMKRKRT